MSKRTVNGLEGTQEQGAPEARKTSIDAKDEETRSTPATGATRSNNLTGMALVNHQCRKPERRYRKCLNDYYSREFVAGRSMEQGCEDKFEAYRGCVLRGIKSEIWDKQGLPPPKEGSPLAELDDN